MTTQYDTIATQFQKGVTDRVLAHTFLHYIGDVNGKSVLDLACGEGFYTRKIKQLGASRVIGVDISAEMLKLARLKESKNPLGIEYIHSSVQTMEKLGEFDLVVAGFLLHYSPNKAELLKMCQVIYANLKSGQRFVTLNNNFGRTTELLPEALAKYNVSYEALLSYPLNEGDIIRVTLGEVQFDIYYYSCQTYTHALEQAGFKNVTYRDLILPPDYDKDFWDFFLKNPPNILIECEK
jgi:SAM-dependent methyltransferase